MLRVIADNLDWIDSWRAEHGKCLRAPILRTGRRRSRMAGRHKRHFAFRIVEVLRALIFQRRPRKRPIALRRWLIGHRGGAQ
jgi:hypothetical protein